MGHSCDAVQDSLAWATVALWLLVVVSALTLGVNAAKAFVDMRDRKRRAIGRNGQDYSFFREYKRVHRSRKHGKLGQDIGECLETSA